MASTCEVHVHQWSPWQVLDAQYKWHYCTYWCKATSNWCPAQERALRSPHPL
jgi:hypothetical protein